MNDADRRALLTHFQDEAEEHIELLSAALLVLEAQPDDREVVAGMLRQAHNLKGAAKLVGATTLERIMHALETILAEVGARRLAPDHAVIDALLESVDAMRESLARLLQGGAEEGAEELVSKLLSLAASAHGIDDRLTVLFPALNPEIRDVLTEFQKSQLLLAREAGKACWELELEAPETEFSARLDAVFGALKDAGEVISLAGLSPTSGGDQRFSFLVATRLAEPQVLALARDWSLRLVNPTLPRLVPPPAVAVPSPDEVAFAEEMAKLVEQYVAEATDEVNEAAKLILALEATPDDPALLNMLFRSAHSFKGSGMTYGLPAVSRVAHHMESLLEAVRGKRVTATTRVTNALLQGMDALHEIFARARTGEMDDDRPLPVLRLLEDAATGVAPESDGGTRAPAPAPTAARSTLSAGDSIRVKLTKLDRLVNLAGEMTIGGSTREAAVRGIESQADASKVALRQWHTLRERLDRDSQALAHLRDHGLLDEYERLGHHLATVRDGLDDLWNRFATTTLQADNNVDALQQAVMQIRMVPVSSLFDTAPRMIRDLTSDNTKAVTLKVSGAETELDKRVLEMMADPLMHLLRNAIDHGLETVEERRQAGKPTTGTLELAAEHRGSHIVITVRDDGRGMDPQHLIAAAVAKGVIQDREAERLTTEQAFGLIFRPGFSTKAEVTAISGRGVGMDVVKSNIDSLKGRIEIDSAPGRGTTFCIHLPLSISVIQVILVESGGQAFCLPTTAIAEIIRVSDEEIQSEEGRACIQYRGTSVPIVRLSDLLDVADTRRPLQQGAVAIAHGIEGTLGFSIDRAVSEQTIVVKEMGSLLRHVPHVAGGTILADGRVSVILDLVSLIAAAIRTGGTWTTAPPVTATTAASRTLLVVDDSLTTRELLRGLLESAGYAVVVARHGREAWELLQGHTAFALVVSDVSMPEMDGLELTAKIKADPRLSRLPVVLVTSLAQPDEKLKGMQAGADAYIVKGAFDQAGLLGRVEELVGHHA